MEHFHRSAAWHSGTPPRHTGTATFTGAPAAAPLQAFAHLDPWTQNQRTPYSEADNRLIADALAAGRPSVRINDVRLSNGRQLRFEIRTS